MKKNKLALEYLQSIGGGVLFSVVLNLFIMPYGLLSANLTGVAQILDGLVRTATSLAVPASFNLTGLFLAAFNIPLILLAARHMNRSFLLKTIATSLSITVTVSLVPVPAAPLLDSVLLSGIVGGVAAGFGIGLTLRAGGSGGGVDIIGLLITKRNPTFSVGRISIVVGALVLAWCLWQYDLNLVVYSAVYTVVYSLTLDKVHYQTIKTGAMIFSKTKAAQTYVMEVFGRGATCWEGTGGYTGEPMYISYTALNKNEAVQLRRQLRALDPGAFVVFSNLVDVMGNYESHL